MLRVYNWKGVPQPFATTIAGGFEAYPIQTGEPNPSRYSASELIAMGHVVVGSDGRPFREQDTFTASGQIAKHTDMHAMRPSSEKVVWKLCIDNTNGTNDIDILVFDGNLLRRHNKSSMYAAGYIAANGTTIDGTFQGDTLNMLQQITSNNSALISKIEGKTANDANQYDIFESTQVQYAKMKVNNIVKDEVYLDWTDIESEDDLKYKRTLELTSAEKDILISPQISLSFHVPKGKKIELEFRVALLEQTYGMMTH